MARWTAYVFLAGCIPEDFSAGVTRSVPRDYIFNLSQQAGANRQFMSNPGTTGNNGQSDDERSKAGCHARNNGRGTKSQDSEGRAAGQVSEDSRNSRPG